MACRVYIVEDSPTIRENLIETLQELAQIACVGSTDAEHEARRWLAGNGGGWDLAIVDLLLREGSGLNILEALQGSRDPGQRVIVLSNHANQHVRWRCRQLGADAVFDKSTEIDALVHYIVEGSPSASGTGTLRSRLGASTPAESRMG